VKTSRDLSAFQPATLLENDSEGDIIAMVWHRDNEDGLILFGWERVETLESKFETQNTHSGAEPAKLSHPAASQMNELHDLRPNTAHLNKKPENLFAHTGISNFTGQRTVSRFPNYSPPSSSSVVTVPPAETPGHQSPR